MKKIVWIIILIAVLVAGYFARQQYGNMAITEEVVEEVTTTGELASTGEVLIDETLEPTDGGETGVDPVIMEQLEAQSETSATGEELTDEDIKLIEDILQQITDSVQE